MVAIQTEPDPDDIASRATQNRHIFQARLTPSTGVDVLTSTVTGAGTVYLTPLYGTPGIVWLYTSSQWQSYTLTERSFTLSAGTASRPHDVFLYDNSGTLTLDLTAWTNGTTRATALTTQDGIVVKSGATARRYVGTVYLDASKQISVGGRLWYVWNFYNPEPCNVKLLDETSHTYSTASWRQWRATATNQVEIVTGLARNPLTLRAKAEAAHTIAATGYVGIEKNGTANQTVNARRDSASGNSVDTWPSFELKETPSIGYGFYSLQQFGGTGGTHTWLRGEIAGEWFY